MIPFALRYSNDWIFDGFLQSKSMFLFRQIRRLRTFLFPSEIPGWCSSAKAYDFTVVRGGGLKKIAPTATVAVGAIFFNTPFCSVNV